MFEGRRAGCGIMMGPADYTVLARLSFSGLAVLGCQASISHHMLLAVSPGAFSSRGRSAGGLPNLAFAGALHAEALENS